MILAAARRKTWVVGLAVLAVIAAFALGWLLSRVVEAGTSPIQTREFFSGAITAVDSTGSSICIRPDAGGTQRCGRAMTNPGSAPLRVGERVGVGVEEISVAGGGLTEVFVVYSPPPPV